MCLIPSLPLYGMDAEKDVQLKSFGIRPLQIFHKNSSSSPTSRSLPNSPRGPEGWQLRFSFFADAPSPSGRSYEKVVGLHGMQFQIDPSKKTITVYPKGTIFDADQVTQQTLEEDHGYSSADPKFDKVFGSKGELEKLTDQILTALIAKKIIQHNQNIASLQEKLECEQSELDEVIKFSKEVGTKLPVNSRLDHKNRGAVNSQVRGLMEKGIHGLTKALEQLNLLDNQTKT